MADLFKKSMTRCYTFTSCNGKDGSPSARRAKKANRVKARQAVKKIFASDWN